MTGLFWLVVPVAVVAGAWLIGSVWRIEARDRERGAALVEFAVLAPLLVLLLIGGVDVALATTEHFQLQAAAQTCTVVHEDECADHAATLGAVVVCFQASDPHCHDDGLTVDRVTVELEAVHASIVLPDITLRAVATGVMPAD